MAWCPVKEPMADELFDHSTIPITTTHYKNPSLFTKPVPILETSWVYMNLHLIWHSITISSTFSLLVSSENGKHTIYPGKSLSGETNGLSETSYCFILITSSTRSIWPCDIEHASRLYGWDSVEMVGWLAGQDRLYMSRRIVIFGGCLDCLIL